MQPIRRWAALSLLVLHVPAVAGPDPLPIESWTIRPAWLGIGIKPFRVGRLITDTEAEHDAATRTPALGTAPGPARLISFAGASIEAPSTSLVLRDTPRFSRLPGKQTEDYEAGVRTTLANGTVALQGGIFYNKFRNLQTSLRQGPGAMTAIAGKAKSYGVEGLMRWTPDKRIALFATYAYRESRLKNRIRDGRKFRLSPDRSAAIGAALLLLPLAEGRITLTPSLSYETTMGLGIGSTGRGPVALVNAQLGYSLGSDIEIDAVAANLLNRRHTRPALGSASPLIAAEPRVLGVRVRLRFGAGG